VIADAVRLLGWGRQWHELADMIARLSERPPPAEIRRVLKAYPRTHRRDRRPARPITLAQFRLQIGPGLQGRNLAVLIRGAPCAQGPLLSRICAPAPTELVQGVPISSGAMIKTQNLVKNYDGLLAVDDLTFSVEPGEVLGFLGPNGAGKSTTMRMIAGFIAPTSGSASICGHDVATEPLAAKAALGYLPEGAPHYGEMSVGGFLDFIADLRHLEGAHRKSRLDYVIGRLQLDGVLEQSIERCRRASSAASASRRPSCTTRRC
jgi:ABC-type glutathione transport system ATPase component